MKVLIVEDEPHAAARLKELVAKIVPNGNVIDSVDSVKAAVSWFNTHPMPDLVLMDIQLADGLSFEIFDQTKIISPVIFTTAYDEYALKAFKVNSIDYLLKPIDEDDFRNAMKKFETLRQPSDSQQLLERIGNAVQMFSKNYKERFVTKVGEHLRFINTSDILFFYSADKVTFGRTSDGRSHILDYTLDQVEGLVNPDHYFRINRKYIIRVEAISDMISHVNSRLKLVLKTSDDNDIIVARERLSDFKNWIDK
ncbi:MAG: LytTR family DNA-binding domain-containing protein [Cyclobacteriaceae bacterium]|nr:response regulator transcription factor [Cyclobacteriaceae bacterium]